MITKANKPVALENNINYKVPPKCHQGIQVTHATVRFLTVSRNTYSGAKLER